MLHVTSAFVFNLGLFAQYFTLLTLFEKFCSTQIHLVETNVCSFSGCWNISEFHRKSERLTHRDSSLGSASGPGRPPQRLPASTLTGCSGSGASPSPVCNGLKVLRRATCGEGRPRWVSLCRGHSRLSPRALGGGTRTGQSASGAWSACSRNRPFGALRGPSSFVSHFLCEENHRPARLHLHEKPHGPSHFPQV